MPICSCAQRLLEGFWKCVEKRRRKLKGSKIMKLTSYLLGLSLAVAAGVVPASAQTVTFQVNNTTNACGQNHNLTLNPQGIYLARGDVSLISAAVTSIRDNAFVNYVPRGNLLINVGRACTFSDCNSKIIVLTCLGGPPPSQAIQFARAGAARRK
jgi:hypothetical protein